MIRTVAAALALLAAAPVAAQEFPAFHDVVGVAADDVLNIRAEPSAQSLIVGTLSPDATGIEVVGRDGGWAIVNTGEGTGYVSLVYLSRADEPSWTEMQTPLTCFGTEPFWGLRVDPAAGTMTLGLMDGPEQTMAIRKTWDSIPQSPLVAFGTEAGVIILRPAACSDGMSDFTYGIAADILVDVSEPGNRADRYFGCCSLTLR